jgi:HK97 family phage portal protein
MVRFNFFKKSRGEEIERLTQSMFFAYDTEEEVDNAKLLYFFNNVAPLNDAINWVSSNLVNFQIKGFAPIQTNWVNAYFIYGNLFLLKIGDSYSIIDNSSIMFDTTRTRYVARFVANQDLEFDISGNGINNNFFLVHLKNINTSNQIMGTSYLLPILQDCCIVLAGNTYNKNVLQNGAKLDGIFTLKGKLTQNQYDNMKNVFQSFFTGVKNVGKTLFLNTYDNDVAYLPNSKTNKDMEFIELIKLSTLNIYKRFKIPLPLINSDSQTFSNYTEAQAQLYDNALEPLVDSWVLQLRQIFKNPKIEVDIATMPFTAKIKMFDIAQRQNEIGIFTINEIRAMLGLEGLTGGDVLRDNKTTPVAYSGNQNINLYDSSEKL